MLTAFQHTLLLFCRPPYLSVALQICHSVSYLFVCLHTNWSATRFAFLPLSLYVCQLGKVSTKWAECKQCPWYPGQGQPMSHSRHSATAACDVWPALPIHLYCSPSSSPLRLLRLFLFLPPFSALLHLIVLLLATSHFFLPLYFPSPCLPSQCPSFLSLPLPISPHQEEPNRKSKFLVEEWSGA